jgi:hypothetical protein
MSCRDGPFSSVSASRARRNSSLGGRRRGERAVTEGRCVVAVQACDRLAIAAANQVAGKLLAPAGCCSARDFQALALPATHIRRKLFS